MDLPPQPTDDTEPAVPLVDVAPGAAVGRFTLVERIGSGGMGVVWAAQDPQLDRRIALKFVRTGVSRSETSVRLLREAQALARVNHPNVVAVHDVGIDGDQIYIAQELVHGASLDGWLAAAPRPVHEIVDVFVQAARGLAAAHFAEIVHRDFKPTNVLVGADGRVRVVDFGLARAQGATDSSPGSPELTALASPLTQTGSVLGTPRYMSPEQHLGLPCDARSDQFSYCVTLAEALYGELPFAAATPVDYALAVIHGDVRPPPRGSRVPRRVRAAIVRGLRSKPEHRFPTMDALIAALATPPRRRAWLGALAGTAAAAALIAGYVSRDHAQAACGGADRKLAGVWDPVIKARTYAAFLATRLPYAGEAWRRAGAALDDYARDWTAHHTDVCEATRVHGEQSEAVMDLRMTCIGQRITELGAATELFGRADERTVEHAAQIAADLGSLAACDDVRALTAVGAPAPAQRATVDEIRARLARARVLARTGAAQAIELATAAVRDARATGHEPTIAEALLALGELQMTARQDDAAERTLRDAYLFGHASHHDDVVVRAAALLIEHLGVNRARVADGEWWTEVARAALRRDGMDRRGEAQVALHSGGALFMRAHYDEARTALERAGELAANDVELADVRNRIGAVLLRQGKYREALAEYRRVVELRERALGADHPDTATARDAIAAALVEQGQLADALVEHRRALAALERALGPDHLRVAQSLVSVGDVLRRLTRDREALPLLERALAIRERRLGPDHPDVAGTLNAIGVAHQRLHDYERALGEYRRSLAIMTKAFGPSHPDVASAHGNVGNTLKALRRYDEALVEVRSSLAIRITALGPTHADVGRAHNNVGAVLADLGKYDEALAEYRRAIAIVSAALGAEHVDLASMYNNVGSVLYEQRKHDAALVELRHAIAIQEKVLGPDNDLVAVSRSNLGATLGELGRFDEALAELRRAREITIKLRGPDHIDAATCAYNIGVVLEQRGAAAEALDEYRKAFAIRERALGAHDELTAEVRGAIGSAHLALHDPARAVELLTAALADLEDPELRFHLARALWERRDRAGALDQARRARDGFRAQPDATKELAEVEAWLAAR